MARLLFVITVLVAAGLVWPFVAQLGFGRLAGEAIMRWPDATFYLPLAAGLVASAAFSAGLWLRGR